MTDRTDPDSADALLRAIAKAPDHPVPSPQNPAHSSVKPGDVLAKKYRVERVLGEGGMGIVVAAHHEDLDKKVALKFLLPKAMQSAEAVGRFRREARIAAKIRSEHVAAVVDVGELENGAPYLVMEYLDGCDLAALLAQRGRLPPTEAVGFVLQACEAIAEAHALGIVHRDLKPGNLFVAQRPGGAPIVKVLDFGISKSASVTQPTLTKTAAVMGSPLYMSPEQMQSSKNVDARTDIWALGVVLYELLSGKIPFSGETMTELIVAVLQSKHEPVRATCPNVPAGLETVVDRCLAKDPAARFAHIGELAGALAPFGPPRSEISMERIEQVLAASSLLTPPASPLVVVERAGGVVVSPQKGTAVAHDASTVRHEEPAVQSVVSAVAPRVSTTTSEGLSTEQGSNAFVRRSARRWAVPVAGLAMMAAFGAVGTLAWRSVTSSVDGVGVPSGQAATSAASVGANAARSETPAVAPAPAGPSLSVEPTSSPLPSTTDGTDAGAVATTHPAATQRQPPPIPRSTPPPPKPDCNPPYTVDSTGVKHYKRECTN